MTTRTNTTKAASVLLLGAIILALFNTAIMGKEHIRTQGEAVLLKLAPRDPRSIMQGDYMALGYQIERDITEEAKSLPRDTRRGYLVIRADENNVGQFIRFDDGGKLAQGEKRVRFHHPYPTRVMIVPDSFFFQEGQGGSYADAKYGIFKFSTDGDYILTGLADENRVEITPPAQQL